MPVKHNILFDLKKLIEYWLSAVKVVVLSNHCFGPFPRIKISFS